MRENWLRKSSTRFWDDDYPAADKSSIIYGIT